MKTKRESNTDIKQTQTQIKNEEDVEMRRKSDRTRLRFDSKVNFKRKSL